MKARHKRLAIVVGGLATLGIAAALVLNAFQSNLVFFFTPTQVAAGEAPKDRAFRIGHAPLAHRSAQRRRSRQRNHRTQPIPALFAQPFDALKLLEPLKRMRLAKLNDRLRATRTDARQALELICRGFIDVDDPRSTAGRARRPRC